MRLQLECLQPYLPTYSREGTREHSMDTEQLGPALEEAGAPG